MSNYVKRNSQGKYYTAGKKYSAETYASIFKVAVKYEQKTGAYLCLLICPR